MSGPMLSFIICIWIFCKIRCYSVNISKLIGIRYMKATTSYITLVVLTARGEPEKLLCKRAHDVAVLVGVVDELEEFVVFIVCDQFGDRDVGLLLGSAHGHALECVRVHLHIDNLWKLKLL